jgi:hypothetical protein
MAVDMEGLQRTRGQATGQHNLAGAAARLPTGKQLTLFQEGYSAAFLLEKAIAGIGIIPGNNCKVVARIRHDSGRDAYMRRL